MATHTGAVSGRLLRVLVALAVAAAVLMIIPPALGDEVPGVIAFDEPNSSVDEDEGTYTVPVRLTVGENNTLSGIVTVTVTATPSGANAATNLQDYTLSTPQIVFDAGSPDGAIENIEISIEDDSLDEFNETFTLSLSIVGDQPGSIGTPGAHIVTIVDDDPTPSVSIGDVSGSEGVSPMVFTVTLSAVSGRDVSMSYATSSGTAMAGSDFTTTVGSLTIDAGDISGTISVPIFNDEMDEDNETFTVTLSNLSNVAPGDLTATGTIIDNDPTPSVSIGDVSGSEGVSPMVFTVTLSAVSGRDVSMSYATSSGTAMAGSDFTTTVGSLTIDAGDISGTISVPILNDGMEEFTETFTVVLSGATNATIANATGTGTILDDDGEPGLAVIDAAAPENEEVIVFTVLLVPEASIPVTVDWHTQNGTALAGIDYQAASGELTFAPGVTEQTVEVTIVDNSIDQVDRTFRVVLSNADPSETNLTIPVAIGTIVDDDNVAPTIVAMKTEHINGAPSIVFAPGQTFRLTGTFTDPGLADAHTVTINWRDGTPATVITVPRPLPPVPTRSFQSNHAYSTEGFFPIEVTVRDGDGGVASRNFVVTISQSTDVDTVGLVDPSQGEWHLYGPDGNLANRFFFGNPGDFPIFGDWNGDGIETPGMYRQSDGFVYLRNSNTQGPADIRFFFGDPGDIPIAGDFNNDGFDTVSIYRPSDQTFHIINKLGSNEGGLGAAEVSYVFGDPGDKPFVGDFNGDGVETVGLHRESTGFVYFRNSHTQGNADSLFFFGDPGDRLIAGDWTGNGVFSPALFRPSNTTMYFRFTNTQGNADKAFVPFRVGSSWIPVSGRTNQ